ncbi:MAG TPA: arginine--tRNA ligase [Candidatus Caccalectryoclostridium excrementigallinarum]|uniref:Arginine--tRNA ligase n=1 Tax=Candidatus Caccalectryoclostridium excrementigallinarum TaxID=2840710 RepID=A0A9D1MMK3_9FIRM|nr:arginine--tRNA ligase [Candidatus Caccalectryoclostridium excrementigallinarum]
MDYKKLLADTVIIEGVESEEIAAQITPCKDRAHGDYSLPCFRLAAQLKKSPAELAKEVAGRVGCFNFLEKAEAIGPFVNFTLNKSAYAKDVLEKVLSAGGFYGSSDTGAGKTVCIDYSSVNIAKPFHIGHLLNTVLGAALYRIYKKVGYHAVGINHLGDWGTQFGKLIVAYKKWGDEEDIEKRGVRALVDIYVKFHKEAEKDPSLDDEARAWFKKIEDGDKEALSIFNRFKTSTLAEVEKIYKRLNVTFDSYAGESFYNDKMQPVLDMLTQKGLLVDDDGAKVVKLGEGMPPCLLVRSDGATLYATRDLAAAFYRKKTYDFDKCLYVVASQQNLHFRQWFKVLELAGEEWYKDLVHVAHGMVSLEEGSLSTRSGNVVYLDDVLDMAVSKSREIIEEKREDLPDPDAVAEQIGVGAVIFGVLYNNRIKDMTFSYSRALNFDGETGPYVQYTHARCRSLTEKCPDPDCDPDYSGVTGAEACEVLKLLDSYPDVILSAAEKYEPCYVSRFLVDLAQAFGKFYLTCNIAKAEDGVKKARLMLVKAVKSVLKDGLELLGIKAPEKM